MSRAVTVIRAGEIPYVEGWELQRSLFDCIQEQKKKNQTLVPARRKPTSGYLIVCQHPHVFTLGRNGKQAHLLLSAETLQQRGITYHHVERGGDITYHGPGQLVIYPILDLENFFTDVRRYMRLLEEAVIQTLDEYRLTGMQIDKLTGVWIYPKQSTEAKKICAMGVKISRWVTLHGLALNVYPDLRYFDDIVPCGIKGHGVTSMEKELGARPDMGQVANALVRHLFSLFDIPDN